MDENSPSIDKVKKVVDYFNVTTDYLLGKKEFDGLYLHFARKAQDLGLDEDDINDILKIYKKHRKKNEFI